MGWEYYGVLVSGLTLGGCALYFHRRWVRLKEWVDRASRAYGSDQYSGDVSTWSNGVSFGRSRMACEVLTAMDRLENNKPLPSPFDLAPYTRREVGH